MHVGACDVAPGGKIGRCLVPRQASLRKEDLRPERGHDILSDLVLDGEDVGRLAIVALSPVMVAGCRVNELCGYAQAVAGLPHASLENVADAELAADLPDIGRPALVGKARIAGDDEEIA